VAEYYVTGGSVPGVKVVDSTTTLEVEWVRIYTKPHGWTMRVGVPLKEWQTGNDDTYLTPPALLTEQLAQGGIGPGGSVQSVAQIQITDANDLLAYYLSFAIGYQPTGTGQGLYTANVVLPFTNFESLGAFEQPLPNGQTPSEALIAAYQQLVKTSNL
jgi:hypothetical protein